MFLLFLARWDDDRCVLFGMVTCGRIRAAKVLYGILVDCIVRVVRAARPVSTIARSRLNAAHTDLVSSMLCPAYFGITLAGVAYVGTKQEQSIWPGIDLECVGTAPFTEQPHPSLYRFAVKQRFFRWRVSSNVAVAR